MAQTGFKGVSFPFRFNLQGGTSSSTTNAADFSHIAESIYQIVMTTIGERRNLPEWGSEVRSVTFSSDDVDARQLEFYVQEAIENFEDRVSVDNVTATYGIRDDDGSGYYSVSIQYTVLKYMKSQVLIVSI